MNIKPVKPQRLSEMLLRPEGKIGKNVQELISQTKLKVEQIAKQNDTHVWYAHKQDADNDVLLISSGTITSRVDLKKKNNASDIIAAIVSNIRVNKQVAEGK